jgi:hypothetical protein
MAVVSQFVPGATRKSGAPKKILQERTKMEMQEVIACAAGSMLWQRRAMGAAMPACARQISSRFAPSWI